MNFKKLLVFAVECLLLAMILLLLMGLLSQCTFEMDGELPQSPSSLSPTGAMSGTIG